MWTFLNVAPLHPTTILPHATPSHNMPSVEKFGVLKKSCILNLYEHKF